jgi:hypothetical protein
VLRALLTADRKAGAETVAAAYGIEPADALVSPHFLIGTPEQMVADLRQRREQWGISYFTMREDSLAELGPVVAELAGR